MLFKLFLFLFCFVLGFFFFCPSYFHLCSILYFQEAFQKRLPSGSTATVALLVDGQILIANVGDSKALLCTEKIESGQQTCSLIVSFPFYFLFFIFMLMILIL